MNKLILPGYNGSGPDHWQYLWSQIDNSFVMLQDEDFSKPRKERWIGNLERTLQSLTGPVVLIAHSLACHQVAHWAATGSWNLDKIQAALLVAPPDPTLATFPKEAKDFLPVPKAILPFASLVIASENDPYGSSAYAKNKAREWAAKFLSVGELGHINSESGIGPWPYGQTVLNDFIQKTGAVHGR